MSREKSLQSDASAETAARYVDAIVKHDTETAASPAKPYRVRRSVAPFLAALMPIFIGLTAFNVHSATRNPDAFDETDHEAAVLFTMILARYDLEAFRDSTGGYPESLTVVGLDELGVDYARSTDGYELQAPVGDSLVTYRRGEDISRIETVFESLVELSR